MSEKEKAQALAEQTARAEEIKAEIRAEWNEKHYKNKGSQKIT